MKKDIEWLRNKLVYLHELDVWNWNQCEPNSKEQSHFYGCLAAYERALDFLDELDEPEVTLNRAFEKVSEIYPMTKGEVCRHLERVVAHGGKVTYGEQEVLSQEWIDDNSVYASHGGITDEYVHVDDLQNLIAPKQELPVIPEYMPGYLEKAKADIDLMRVMDIAYNHNEIDKFNKHYDWIRDNHELFARAWMDGYTVEKEQRYYVLDPKGIPLLGRGNGQAYKTTTALRIHETCMDKSQYALTEQEIKDYDLRFMAFAKPVEEMEK